MFGVLTKKQQNSKTITNRGNSVASVLVQKLEQLGVSSIFGYPGASVLSIYNELSKSNKIRHYLVRHEQAALHAAEGYARTSGKTGVVLVTSGPGFTNTITGIANANSDSTPLVILAGDVSGSENISKTFQNVNIKEMVKTCSKNVYMLNSNSDITEILDKAFTEANSGIKGPIIIGLPRNLLECKYVKSPIHKTKKHYDKCNLNKQIKKLNDLIQNSKKPLILIGGGAIDASEEIKKITEQLNCPIVSTLMGIGIYPSNSKNYLGMVGINGTFTANTALNKCDLLIALGVSFSDRTVCKNKKFASKTKIVNINIEKNTNKFEMNIKSNVKDFLSDFLRTYSDLNINKDWQENIEYIKEENVSEHNYKFMNSPSVLKIISQHTAKYEPTVVTDVGQHQMLTAQFFTFNKPRKFITSGGMGTMGFGLPAAIGAQAANPNQLILNITGDGSFQMNLQELATCREHHIPIKIIILNNGYLGMVRQLQERIYHNTYQVKMINPDFTKIAEAYDLLAVRVTKEEEIIPALDKIINHNGTAIMDIMIDSHENI